MFASLSFSSPHIVSKILFTAQTILLCPQFAFLTPIHPKRIQIFIQTKHLSSQGGSEFLRACDFQHIVAQEMSVLTFTHCSNLGVLNDLAWVGLD